MKGLARALLAHHDRCRRDLPWRSQRSAYRTLVSELMLQQTVVATVIPYFQRFMARFPDLATLAAATEEDVLTLWSGLGYYSRARNLHRAAIEVVRRHGGQLPASEDELRELPGVGPYTAAAIAAIAFGQRTLAVDGNVLRVLARLFGEGEPIDRPAVKERLRRAGAPLVPDERPGDFAEALMELGALICVPGTPRCPTCPIARWCEARASGRQELLPVRLPRRPKLVVHLACAAAVRGSEVLLVRREEGTLLAGTWALPAVEVADKSEPEATLQAALAAAHALGLTAAGGIRSAGAIRHVFTHRDVTAEVFTFPAREALPSQAGEGEATDRRWVRLPRPENVALSSFTRKTLALL